MRAPPPVPKVKSQATSVMGSFRQSATSTFHSLSGSASRAATPLSMAQRVTLLVLIFVAEWISVVRSVHVGGVGIGGLVVFRLSVVCAPPLLALGYVKAASALRRISAEIESVPIGWRYLAGHAAALLAFVCLSQIPLDRARPYELVFVAVLAYTLLALMLACGLFALIPPGFTWRIVKSAGFAWVYALPVGVLAWRLMSVSPFVGDYIWNGPFWKPATDLTFGVVKALLSLFLPSMVADRETMTLGSPDFAVTIRPGCTGWEGTALIFVFSIWWLYVLRREFRFPRALLLIPAGMVTMWLSNAIRLTVLVLIGVRGAPDVAMKGFHSEAGWIAFNCVALAFAVASRRVPWFRRTADAPVHEAVAGSSTAAYLMPMIAILAAGMISRATAADFESLYPLRLVAAGIALWFFRSKYAQMDWRFGWLSFGLGSMVFAMWLAMEVFSGRQGDGSIASALAIWPGPVGIVWLVCRTAAAVLTVPIAEELAFRGFLIRYIVCRDFESLKPREFTFFAVLISSVIFGLLHGSRWLAGTMAGLVYAIAFLRRGRIGDAVLAHATTNAWLAGWGLWTGHWFL